MAWKPGEGGHLRLAARDRARQAAGEVADTGWVRQVGDRRHGVGLANIRERLQLLYGFQGDADWCRGTSPRGTVVTVTVPLQTIEGTMA